MKISKIITNPFQQLEDFLKVFRKFLIILIIFDNFEIMLMELTSRFTVFIDTTDKIRWENWRIIVDIT